MIEPTGPLPPAVYWRRRGLAVVVCVVAVLLLAWIIGGLVGSADEHPVRGTAASQDLVVAPPSSPASSARAAAQSSTRAPSPTMSSDAAAPDAHSAPSSSTGPARPGSSRAPAPKPAPPRPCPDEVIKVAAQPDAESYRVGERPLLRLVVVNTGDVPCTRDVSRKLRELVITTADGKRLWSSNDCYPPVERDKRTLAPGQSLRFSLNWAGRTSAPGCPLERETVEAGNYRVIGKLGKLTSPPTPLTLTP
jgi:hypothetical protein